MTLDSTTWAALALVLTALGAGWTYLSFQRRGVTAGVRGIAWTLLPIAAWSTGTLELAGDIAADVGSWATALAFSPVVWAGIVLAGLSVVLFAGTSVARRRDVGTRARAPRSGQKATQKTAQKTAQESHGAAQPSETVTDGRPGRLGSRSTPTSDAVLDDDVSEILRKHGIS